MPKAEREIFLSSFGMRMLYTAKSFTGPQGPYWRNYKEKIMTAKLFPNIRAMISGLIVIIILTACSSPSASDLRATANAMDAKTPTATVQPTAQAAAPTATDVHGVLPTAGGLRATAQVDGTTDCKTMEQLILATMPGVPLDQVGTEKYPIVYPSTWLHDLCFSWTGGGTGAKYVKVSGPTALQMGEATGPHRMVFVPAGTTFTGHTQGGWRYVSEAALSEQWAVESITVGRLGLICGYIKNTKLFAPAYKWNGSAEVRDVNLDCPYSVAVLLSGKLTSSAATVTPKMSAYSGVAEIFKVEYQNKFYCGARIGTTAYPAGTRVIEQYSEGDSWLYNAGQNGLTSDAGFCKGAPVDVNGNPVTQKIWITAILNSIGYIETAFPLQ